jgi:hypothetical protein
LKHNSILKASLTIFASTALWITSHIPATYLGSTAPIADRFLVYFFRGVCRCQNPLPGHASQGYLSNVPNGPSPTKLPRTRQNLIFDENCGFCVEYFRLVTQNSRAARIVEWRCCVTVTPPVESIKKIQ